MIARHLAHLTTATLGAWIWLALFMAHDVLWGLPR